MNELFDKLILRIFFAFFICLIIYIYKYAHLFLYPSSRIQMFKKFYPSRNMADTLHLFGRLIGIGIIFSGLFIQLDDGLLYALISFFIKSVISLILYLLSIYLLESISLFNFEYVDEIIKRKNVCYGLISFTQAICLAFIIHTIILVAQDSLVIYLFLWLFAIVLFGFATKLYKIISQLSFNKLIIHKNMALAYSFSGFLFGATIIIISSLKQEFVSIEDYALLVILKILLSAIIYPIFQKGLSFIFKLEDDLENKTYSLSEEPKEISGPSLGYGLYEGSIFFTASFLTSIITNHIYFGSFYPLF